MLWKITFFTIAAASGATVRAIPIPEVADMILNYIFFPIFFGVAVLFAWPRSSLWVRMAVVFAAFAVAHAVDLTLRPIVFAPDDAFSLKAGFWLLGLRIGLSLAQLVPSHFIFLRHAKRAA